MTSNDTLSSSAPTPSFANDVDTATFKAKVLDASMERLVLAFFWTPRSNASLSLGTTLEKMASASNGAIFLAKINVDQNQPLALQLGAQSIPSVFAFYQGRPVDAFAGALAEDQVKAWCDKLLKTLGLGQDASAAFDQAFEQAASLVAAGDTQTAESIYADIVRHDPDNAKAYAGLISCLIRDSALDQAKKSLASLPETVAKDHVFDKVRAALELAEQAEKSKGQTTTLKEAVAKDPNDHAARFDLALALHATGKKEDALDHLLDIIRRDRTWNDGAARKQLLKFFEAFGDDDPLTIAARRKLSALLFA